MFSQQEEALGTLWHHIYPTLVATCGPSHQAGISQSWQETALHKILICAILLLAKNTERHAFAATVLCRAAKRVRQ